MKFLRFAQFAVTLGALVLALRVPAQTNFTQRFINAASPSNILWGFAAGGSTLVAVGQPGRILSSTDGVNWTPRVSGTNEWLVSVAFGNGLFVIVGENGRVLRSTNGITWTPAASVGTTTRLNGVIYAGGRWVAVGENGIILISADADTWTTVGNVTTNWLHGIAYGAGYYCVVGQSGTIFTSPDARTWTRRSANTTRNLEVVTFLNNWFAAVGESGECVFAFAGGGAPSWANVPIYKPQTTANLRSVASINGSIVAVADDGSAYSTPNVCNYWTKIPTGTNAFLNGVGFAQDTFFLIGVSERILESEAIYHGRLGNLSTRGTAGSGANTLISGLVVRGTTPKRVLLRGAGPALAQFGVTSVLDRPVLGLFDSAGNLVASNAGWPTGPDAAQISAAAQAVGAFAFSAGSADSALILNLNPGAYTAQVSAVGGATGIALIEAYDLDNPATMQSRLTNISSRGVVGTGQNIVIPGVSIGGSSARLLLVRAIGPGPTQFGVTGTIGNPQIVVTSRSTSGVVSNAASNDDWNTQNNSTVFSAADVRDYASRAAAFGLTEGSRDAALILSTATLLNYTIQVSGVNGDTGVTLVEVYDVTDL
jgi:hypothetical protein